MIAGSVRSVTVEFGSKLVFGCRSELPLYFFAALTFAHLARCAAAIFLRADADMVRLGFVLPAWSFAALFAHRAFCARLIRLRVEADSVRLAFV